MQPIAGELYYPLTVNYCVFAFVCLQQEVVLTDEEMAIKAYLSDGDPLPPHILDMVIAPYWKQEPYKYLYTHPHKNANFQHLILLKVDV